MKKVIVIDNDELKEAAIDFAIKKDSPACVCSSSEHLVAKIELASKNSVSLCPAYQCIISKENK